MKLGTLVHGAAAPVRLGLTAGEIALEVALGLVRGTRRALDGDRSHEQRVAPFKAPPPPPSRQTAPARPEPAPPPRRPEAATPPPVPPAAAEGPAVPVVPPPAGAKTVDDDPVPVGEFGGEGAAEGAGAEVTVDEPWDGYDTMTAAQIQKRLAGADREALAAVVLHEGVGRKRKSVIAAAEKRLRQLSV